MIYAPASPTAHTIPLDEALVRLAEAAAGAAMTAEDCQAHVGALLGQDAAAAKAHGGLQRLDALTQTLQGMTRILARLAIHVPAGVTIETEGLVDGVGLADLADLVRDGVRRAPAPDGELELF